VQGAVADCIVTEAGSAARSSGIVIPAGGHCETTRAYDASINFLDREDVMRERYHTAGFRILEWMNYSNAVIETYERTLSASPNKLTNRLILGDDASERQRNSQRNLIEGRTIYWMITAERPKL
jgi:hypothetical protein